MADDHGFSIGGTEFKLGGFIDFDAHITGFDSGTIGGTSLGRDMYVGALTPVGPDNNNVMTDFTAQASRFFVTASRKVGDTKLSGKIEIDFLGSAQGNERVSNSYSPRLRHAVASIGGLTVGQTWSTFQNTSAIPESATFLALSDGMIFIRQPVVSYKIAGFQLALENGLTNVTQADGSRLVADNQYIPDVIARYNLKGDFGNVSVAGIVRPLRANIGGNDKEAVGYGGSISGRVNIGKSDVRFSFTGGQGLGRYIGLNAVNSATVKADDSLLPVTSYGGLVAFRQPLTFIHKTARANLGYSFLMADYSDDSSLDAGVTATRFLQSGYVALLYDPFPKFTVGLETILSYRTSDDDPIVAGATLEDDPALDGMMWRVSMSAKYSF